MEKEKIKIYYQHVIMFTIICIAIAIGFGIFSNPDTDVYFLVANGRYIINNKCIPKINPWVIHDNLKVVVQQWVCSILNYEAVNLLGDKGIYVLAFIMMIICNLAVYYYTTIVIENIKVRLWIIAIAQIILFPFYTTRPFAISISILLFEMATVEKFYQKDYIRPTDRIELYVKIAICSIIQINYQAATWILLIVFPMAYIVPNIIFKLENTDYKPKESLSILEGLIIIVITGFINPYGLKAMTYGLKGYGTGNANNMIKEMLPTTFLSIEGIAVVASVIVIVLYLYNREANIRYIYLSLGSVIISIMNFRGKIYLIFVIITITGVLLDKSKLNITSDDKYRYDSKKSIIIEWSVVIIIVAQILFLSGYIAEYKNKINNSLEFNEAVDYLNKQDDIKLFTGYNIGLYFINEGFKVYIDARAELYCKAINEKEDIYKEYLNILETGNPEVFKEFIDKYKFTHMVVLSNSKLDQYLKLVGNYREILHNNSYTLYESNDYK